MIHRGMSVSRREKEMDLIFLLAVLFVLWCFIFRKKLAVFFHSRKKTEGELPLQRVERPEVVTYKVLAYNARDFKDTKELESMMELRLDKCLAGLAKQGVRYEVEFHATGFVMVYLVRYWY